MSEKNLFYSTEVALKRYEQDIIRKEIEIKYRSLFEKSKDAIFIYKNDKFIDLRVKNHLVIK